MYIHTHIHIYIYRKSESWRTCECDSSSRCHPTASLCGERTIPGAAHVARLYIYVFTYIHILIYIYIYYIEGERVGEPANAIRRPAAIPTTFAVNSPSQVLPMWRAIFSLGNSTLGAESPLPEGLKSASCLSRRLAELLLHMRAAV